MPIIDLDAARGRLRMAESVEVATLVVGRQILITRWVIYAYTCSPPQFAILWLF